MPSTHVEDDDATRPRGERLLIRRSQMGLLWLLSLPFGTAAGAFLIHDHGFLALLLLLPMCGLIGVSFVAKGAPILGFTEDRIIVFKETLGIPNKRYDVPWNTILHFSLDSCQLILHGRGGIICSQELSLAIYWQYRDQILRRFSAHGVLSDRERGARPDPRHQYPTHVPTGGEPDRRTDQRT